MCAGAHANTLGMEDNNNDIDTFRRWEILKNYSQSIIYRLFK